MRIRLAFLAEMAAALASAQEFRAEAFNAFVTPIDQGPDTGLTSNSFGRVTIAQQNFPRSMQFAFRLSF